MRPQQSGHDPSVSVTPYPPRIYPQVIEEPVVLRPEDLSAVLDCGVGQLEQDLFDL
jgi:hypothetical protein